MVAEHTPSGESRECPKCQTSMARFVELPGLFMNGLCARRVGPVAGGAPAQPGSDTHSPESPLFARRAGLGGPTPPGRAGAPPAPPTRFFVCPFTNNPGDG